MGQRLSCQAVRHLKKFKPTHAGDVVLAHVGCNLPKNAIDPEDFSFLLKRIVSTLDDLDDRVVMPGLSFLYKYVCSDPQLIAQHVTTSTILPLLLSILTRDAVPPLLLALQCLLDAKPHWNAQNYHLDVIRGMARVANHPARVVRNAASTVRNAWCLSR